MKRVLIHFKLTNEQLHQILPFIVTFFHRTRYFFVFFKGILVLRLFLFLSINNNNVLHYLICHHLFLLIVFICLILFFSSSSSLSLLFMTMIVKNDTFTLDDQYPSFLLYENFIHSFISCSFLAGYFIICLCVYLADCQITMH